MTVRLLTVKQVALALGVCERTVWRELEAGTITSHKVRGARRVSEAALVAYVERGEMPATTARSRPARAFRSTGRLGEGPDPLASSRLGE